jgi:hypothetical protein
MFTTCFVLVALASVLLVGWIDALDRAARYRRHGGDLPTITALPRYVCIPTAWRRR